MVSALMMKLISYIGATFVVTVTSLPLWVQVSALAGGLGTAVSAIIA